MRGKTNQPILKLVLFSSLLTLGMYSARAQMAGSYTIDSTAAASSTNFKNWYSFWRSLQGQSRTDGGSTLAGGISATVNVTVKTDLTDTSKVRFDAISGTSSTKVINIDGNNKTITYSGSGEVISFSGGDYISIKNLTIRHTGTSASAAICVRLFNGSDNNSITNCTLEFTKISTGATNGSAYVAFCSSASNLNTVVNTLTGSNNTIKSNLCRTTNTNSPGPAFAFVMNGSLNTYKNTAQNNTFDSNTIQNFYFVAVQGLYGNGNQFSRNNISRSNSSLNNCYSSLYIFNLRNSFSSSREFKLNNNNIHDLPFVGASPSNGVSNFFGIYALDNIGNSSYGFIINGNTFKNISAADNHMLAYIRNTEFGKITQNVVDKLQGYNTTSYSTIWDIVTGDELDFSGNSVINCALIGKSNQILYCDSFTASVNEYCTITDNLFQKNTFFYESYMMYPMNGNWKIMRNRLLNNKINGNNGGYLVCMAPLENEKVQILNNLIANNEGEEGVVGIYAVSYNTSATNFSLHQNTIYLDGSNISSGAYDIVGLYLAPFYFNNIRVSGNILQLMEANSSLVTLVDVNNAADVKLYDNNTYYIRNISSETWQVPGGTQVADFTNWMGLGFAGNGENFLNPKFTDPANNIFKSTRWLLQNNVATETVNPKDFDLTSRNPVRSDRGVYETVADIKAVSSNFSIPSTICSGPGNVTKKMSIKVQNMFSDTVYDFNVSYTINGGAKVTQKVTKKIAPNDTFTVNFVTPVSVNAWGKARIAVFVDVPDDKTSNDSIIFNTTVNPSPGGRKWSASSKPTKAIYKGTNPYAITYPGQPLYFNITPPRNKVNSDYNTKWSSSVYAVTQGGVPLNSSATTNTSPAGGSDQEVSLKVTSKSLEDTLVKVCVITRDLSNGCDTTECHNMLIAPITDVDFSYPTQVCGNDTAKFFNKSSIKSGGMRFHWDFGTGKSKDTSNESDPIFLYTTAGTYKVKLMVYSLPYGFMSYDSAYVTVGPKPTAKFTRTNACEGIPIAFTNQTTPSNSTYDWDFGDGSTHSTATNPTYKYTSAGQYTVKLKAKLGGCVDSTSLKVLQYARPKAGFTKTSGTCDNELVQFNNTTTYTGVYSSYWYFPGSSTPSTVNDGSFKFTAGGSKTVKLVVKSDFGCLDSITQVINLKDAPKPSYTQSEGCTGRPTVFVNTTPAVNLTTANYSWEFSDGTKSTAKNVNKTWSSTGPKTIKMKVTLDNGCKDSISSTLIVRNQAKADFTTNSPVCYGTAVNFTNTSTWPAGNISYSWNFADGNTTNTGSPSHVYKTNKSTSYMVQLIAKIDTSCADTMIKKINVNEMPKTCNFVAETDYSFGFHGISVSPLDSSGAKASQAGITYYYSIPAIGINNSTNTQYNLPSDGNYNITQCAVTSSSPACTCCTTLKFVMDRANLNKQQKQYVSVYPNPNNGQFTIAAGAEFGSIIKVEMRTVTGALAKSFVYTNNGNYTFQASDLADGVYVLNFTSGQNNYTTRMEIRH